LNANELRPRHRDVGFNIYATREHVEVVIPLGVTQSGEPALQIRKMKKAGV